MNEQRQRNHFIDLLKAICLIFVVITHSAISISISKKALYPFYIDMAVPILMIITGYVATVSADKKQLNTFKKQYNPILLLKKFLRFTIPYLIFFGFQQLGFYINSIVLGNGTMPTNQLYALITGGYGPGTYYYPVMIKFIIVFPLIYFLINRNPSYGLIICIGINLLFEILKTHFGMTNGTYRMLLVRHLAFIAFGAYVAKLDKVKVSKMNLILTTILGVIYLYYINYTGVKPVIFNLWSNVVMLALLYIGPAMAVLLKKYEIKPFVKIEPLCIMGKASFNIYLVQMLYFSLPIEHFFISKISNGFVVIMIDVLICSIVGVLFYLVEHPLTTRINKLITPKPKIKNLETNNN